MDVLEAERLDSRPKVSHCLLQQLMRRLLCRGSAARHQKTARRHGHVRGSQRGRVTNLEAGPERGKARARVPSAGQLHQQGTERPASSALSPQRKVQLLGTAICRRSLVLRPTT